MNGLIDWFIRILNLDSGDKKRNYGYFEGILSVLINLVLFAMKFYFGTLLNSVALRTDALHTLSDVITSAIVIYGFRLATKPPDEEHPFGHGRAERVLAIVIACMLIIVGGEFFIDGLYRFRNPVLIQTNTLILILLIVSVGAKEFLFKISSVLGQKIDSASLKADAWHHRTDSIATLLVVVGLWLYRFGLYHLDGLLGMGIALLIVYTGITIIREAGSFLIGKKASAEMIEMIKETALGCDGVNDVHHIHVHDYGGQFEITVHIRLRGDTQLDEAHQKASEVESSIKRNIPGAEVTVHIEPEIIKQAV